MIGATAFTGPGVSSAALGSETKAHEADMGLGWIPGSARPQDALRTAQAGLEPVVRPKHVNPASGDLAGPWSHGQSRHIEPQHSYLIKTAVFKPCAIGGRAFFRSNFS